MEKKTKGLESLRFKHTPPTPPTPPKGRVIGYYDHSGSSKERRILRGSNELKNSIKGGIKLKPTLEDLKVALSNSITRISRLEEEAKKEKKSLWTQLCECSVVTFFGLIFISSVLIYYTIIAIIELST